MVRRAYDHVPFFRKRMDERKLTPADVRTMEDIVQLPFTVKTDLRDTYPFGLFASPMKEIVRLHASSGTTGKPIVVAYTQEDIEDWSRAWCAVLRPAVCTAGDIIQNAYGYGLFTGGLGAHYGAEALGATVIPISGGNTDRQIMVMKDFGVTAICCTPELFSAHHRTRPEMGVNIKELPLRTGVFGAEPWTEAMRRRIEADSGIKAYDIYGLSEIIGPGVAMECATSPVRIFSRTGFIRKSLIPRPVKPLADGEEGELVLTTLGKQRHADDPLPHARHHLVGTGRCACGRTLRRISRISRRSDDMLIIRGVNLFPSQIETALLKVEGTLPHYQIILDRQKGLDKMEVQVEVTREAFSDTVGALEQLQKQLAQTIEGITGLRPAVSWFSRGRFSAAKARPSG